MPECSAKAPLRLCNYLISGHFEKRTVEDGAEVVDDHVEVKTAFAVTNTGDAAALVTEDGFDIVKTIEPGETKYYTKTVSVGRMPGNEQPLENVMKTIDESEVAFEISFNINYRPANHKEQFRKVAGHFNIGKHKVTEVAKVLKP